MDNKLIEPKKVEVRKSKIHGYGVFAKEPISAGEIIEECHLIKIPIKMGHIPEFMVEHKFGYPAGSVVQEHVLPLGYGCIYNHSDNNNAMWKNHPTKKLFQFYAIRNIEVGEEVCTYYGDERYWDTVNKLKEKTNETLI